MPDPTLEDDFRGFKESFLAEAEEHLLTIEHGVLNLEGGLGQAKADAGLLQEVFRSVHTVKGLAAMLEYEPIVALCHRLEAVLRGIDRGSIPYAQPALDHLVESAQALARLLADVQLDRPLSPSEDLVNRLDQLLEIPATSVHPPNRTSTPGEACPSTSGSASSLRCYEVRFQPNPRLAARGISITSVREGLAEIGHLEGVQPEVATDGSNGICFIIHLAANCSPAEVAAAASLELSAVQEIVSGSPEEQVGGREDQIPVERADAPRSNIVRVEIGRLDELMRLVGELVVSRARIGWALEALDRTAVGENAFGLQEAAAQLDRHLRDLREAVMRVRMVPIREAFARMPLVVRDAAREDGKKARVELVGEDTELDKMLVDRLADPLLHLVRNAVDHGLESPALRKANGKPEAGLIRLKARPDGDRVLVEVSDDGGGIDREAVARRAAARGRNPREVRESDDGLLEALCLPGLSTRERAGRTSGRGVGMDVVLQRVREMNGTLDVRTEVGKGTTFTIRVPLTLAVVQALTAACAGQRFAVPIAGIDEVTEVSEQEIVGVEGIEIFQRRGEVLSLLRLNDAFHLPRNSERDTFHALIANVGGGRWAIGVDRLIGEQGVIVKSLADPLVRTPGVVGAADLGDGQLVLVVDVAELIRLERSRRGAAEATALRSEADRRPRIPQSEGSSRE